jgi:hypothetical protein
MVDFINILVCTYLVLGGSLCFYKLMNRIITIIISNAKTIRIREG